MSLPRSWPDEGWVTVEMNGTDIRVKGVTFKEYQNALDGAIQEGAVGARAFCEYIEDNYGAETEVIAE